MTFLFGGEGATRLMLSSLRGTKTIPLRGARVRGGRAEGDGNGEEVGVCGGGVPRPTNITPFFPFFPLLDCCLVFCASTSVPLPLLFFCLFFHSGDGGEEEKE